MYDYLCNLVVDKDFLDRTQKALIIDESIDKWGFIKFFKWVKR